MLSDLPEMPGRIARLPRDRRGYPIPWNVQRGKEDYPLFTVNDMWKHALALRAELCPICGERLGRWRWFVGGIRSAFDPHGAYYDLPGHRECEFFALQVCPYLSAPRYLGRIDVVDPSKVPDGIIMRDITMIPERPEIFVASASDRAEISLNDNTPILIPAKPYLALAFWRHGKQISDEEAMPFLRGALGDGFTIPAMRE